MTLRRMVVVFFAALALAGCGGEELQTGAAVPGLQGQVQTLGALGVTRTEGAFAAVSVSQGATPVTDATVTVNGVPLAFGPRLDVQARTLEQLPIYCGAVTGTPGGPAEIRVLRGQSLIYQATTTIPGDVTVLDPAAGATLPVGQDLLLRWANSGQAASYYADYASTESDAYRGILTSGLTTTIPASALAPGGARVSVTALSEPTGLPDGTTLTSADDLSQDVPSTGSESPDGSLWVAFTEAESEVNLATPRQLLRGSERLTVAQTTYVTQQGIRLKQNVYNPVQTQAAGNINFTLRFERWTIAVGAVVVIDGATNQTVFQWNKQRIYKPKREKYNFSIPAQTGYVLVILERQVDTIWGPDFVF